MFPVRASCPRLDVSHQADPLYIKSDSISIKDKRISAWLKAARYRLALTMENSINIFSNKSKSLFAIYCFAKSGLEIEIDETFNRLQLLTWKSGFYFITQIIKHENYTRTSATPI